MSVVYGIATIPQHLVINIYKCLYLVYPYLPSDTIGERIYKIRKRKRIKQKELAALINVKYQVIWKAESKNIFSQNTYNLLLDVLGQDLEIN